jgi:glycosyltransferase involved in cell wall biosynthesis
LPATRDVLPGSTACVRVTPGSAPALAEAINGILARPEEGRRAVAAERQRMIDQFDWSRVASRYSKLIEQVIVENRRTAEGSA